MTSQVFCNSRSPRRHSWARYSASFRAVSFDLRRQIVCMHNELNKLVVLKSLAREHRKRELLLTFAHCCAVPDLAKEHLQ